MRNAAAGPLAWPPRALALLAILLAVPCAPALAAEPAASTETLASIPAETLAAAAALRQTALDDGRAYELLRTLTVEVGPRLAGSDGDRRAVAWGVAAMRRLGLTEVRAEPVTVPRWVRGDAAGAITAPHPQPVVLTALGGSVATPEGGIEAEVLEVESIEALATLPEGAAEGKIVFFNKRMRRTRDGSGYGAVVAARGRGASAAAERGAVASIIRSAGTSTSRLAHTGGMRYAEGARKIPAAALSNADADLLAAQLAGDQPVRFHLRLDTRDEGSAESANVIGEVRGRERPEEIVLLGCHLDSWDLGQGAHDDGSGCATVLMAGALLAELPAPPRRTVRVVLFANEEFGLSGARAYARAHADELGNHVAATESDLGAGRVYSFTSGVEPHLLPLVEQIGGVLAPLGVRPGPNNGRGGADLIPLRPARVPQFGLWQDVSEYFDLHHTIDDTFDKIDPAALAQNVAAYTTFAYLAAEMPGTFGRASAPPATGE